MDNGSLSAAAFFSVHKQTYSQLNGAARREKVRSKGLFLLRTECVNIVYAIGRMDVGVSWDVGL